MSFTSLRKVYKNAVPKTFCCFDFSSSIFNLQGHTLSTGGSALTNHILFLEVFGLYHGAKVLAQGLLCHRQRDLTLETVHLLHESGLVSQSRSTYHTLYLDPFLCLSHATQIVNCFPSPINKHANLDSIR